MTAVLARPAGRRALPWLHALPAGWSLRALVVLYPLWWALGLTTFIFAIAAVPMAVHLTRRRAVRVPPGFGIWLVLLAWVALSGLMLDETLTGTMQSPGHGRYIAFAMRLVNYSALTIIMLYVLNLEEHELSRRRIARLLGLFGVYAVIGGFAGIFLSGVRFTAPIAYLLPGSIAADPFVASLMRVETAQIHLILPGPVGQARPSAPFEYTNEWGENVCLLLVWLFLAAIALGRGLRRVVAVAVLAAAVVPVVMSLNRGLWIGLAIAVGYVSVRLARQRRYGPVAGVLAALAVAGVLMVATPLGTVVEKRFANGHSNDIRTTLDEQALRAAASSPVLGYGGNRTLLGSNRSIAVGKSADCPLCGNFDIGSDGQLWHLLVSQGFVGALAYNLFFLYNLWRFRRDRTPVGIAGSLVLVLTLVFQFVYSALGPALCWGLIAVAVLARNERHRSPA